MLKLKKIEAGIYVTSDGKYTVEKYDGYWYAADSETGQSVIDCEDSMKDIRDSLESYLSRQ